MKAQRQRLDKFIEAHPKSRIVIKGLGYLLSERMLKFIVGFFVHALVARYLGPDHFGKLSYIIKTVNIFYTFSLFGADELILSELMGKHYAREDVLSTVFKLRMGTSVIGFFALGIFLLISRPESTMFSLLTLAYGVNIFLQAFNLFELNFQASLSFKPLFWANNISYLSSSFLRLIGIWTHQTISFFLSTYIVGEIILKSLVQRKAGLQVLKGKFKAELAWSLAKLSMPFFLSSFVVLLDQRLSFIFLEQYRTNLELGNYSVAVTLVDLWLFLPTAVCAAVFPTLVTAFHGNVEAYKIRKQYLTDIVVWLAFSFSVGVILTSELVIHLLYGDKYANAPSSLAWYSLTTIPLFFNLVRVKTLSLEKNLHQWLILSCVCLILNFAGHLWAVPSFGVKGAISSYLVSQVAGNFILAVFMPSIRGSIKSFLRTFMFPFRLIARPQ